MSGLYPSKICIVLRENIQFIQQGKGKPKGWGEPDSQSPGLPPPFNLIDIAF
jgi:hypothetical protein